MGGVALRGFQDRDPSRETMLAEVLDQIADYFRPLTDANARGRRRNTGCLQKRFAIRRDGNRLAVTIGFMDETLRQRLRGKASAHAGRHEGGVVDPPRPVGCPPLYLHPPS